MTAPQVGDTVTIRTVPACHEPGLVGMQAEVDAVHTYPPSARVPGDTLAVVRPYVVDERDGTRHYRLAVGLTLDELAGRHG